MPTKITLDQLVSTQRGAKHLKKLNDNLLGALNILEEHNRDAPYFPNDNKRKHLVDKCNSMVWNLNVVCSQLVIPGVGTKSFKLDYTQGNTGCLRLVPKNEWARQILAVVNGEALWGSGEKAISL